MTKAVVRTEGVELERLDSDLLAACLVRLERAFAGPVEVVLAADMTASARQRLSEANAEVYEADRISGTVGGKTFPDRDPPEVLIYASLLIPGVIDWVDVPRLFEHEGWHLALSRRSEDYRELAASTGLTRLGAEAQHFLGHSFTLVDEYRVERALVENSKIPQSYIDTTDEVLANLALSLQTAVAVRGRGGDLEPFVQATVEPFFSLTTHLSYLVAAGVSADRLENMRGWDRFVDPHYERMRSVLDSVASAAEPEEIESLIESARELALELSEWFMKIGFKLTDHQQGGFQFDVLRQDFYVA